MSQAASANAAFADDAAMLPIKPRRRWWLDQPMHTCAYLRGSFWTSRLLHDPSCLAHNSLRLEGHATYPSEPASVRESGLKGKRGFTVDQLAGCSMNHQ
jgi:hypothetical protein